MKQILNILFILIFTLTVISCSSVRNRNAVKGKEAGGKVDKRSGAKAFRPKLEEMPKDRFSDTTIIYLNQVENFSTENPHYNTFQNALYLFNNEEFSQACNLFKNIADNYKAKDDITWDTHFHLAECLILSNDYINAEKVLINAINTLAADDEFMQKYIVRLGQTYCYQGKISLAQRQFDRLKNEYPNSKYLKAAKCD